MWYNRRMKKFKLGVIGCGNMACAIIDGALKNRVIKPQDVALFDINDAVYKRFEGCGIADNAASLLTSCEYVLLALKPQIFKNLIGLHGICTAKCVISVMAGVKISCLTAFAPQSEIIRTMPNTPAQIGQGVTVITKKQAFCHSLFSSIGRVLYLPEDKFSAVTALSGSGPAYVYYFLQAVTEAANRLGIDGECAKQLIFGTFNGALQMAEHSPCTLDELILQVRSPGGTTEAAFLQFEKGKLLDIIKKGINAAAKRADELAT